MTKHPEVMSALVLAGALLLAACTGGAGHSGAADTSTDPLDHGQRRSFANAPSSAVRPSAGTGEVPELLLREVVEAASERTGAPSGSVTIITAEPVTWSDGSLGCPEPGQLYTQALVPGFRIVVEVMGEQLAYHASDNGTIRHCERPQPPASGAP